MLMGNELHLAPIVDHPQKILDLGTGSGIWAIDMAEQYPSAKVIGVDTTPVQPNVIPPNLVFEVCRSTSVGLPLIFTAVIRDIEPC